MVEFKDYLGSPDVKKVNFANTTSQGRKHGYFSYRLCQCIMVSKWTLLFSVEGKGYLRLQEVTLREPYTSHVTTLFQSRNNGYFKHIRYRFVTLRDRSLLFWRRWEVIWSHQMSKTENFVKTKFSVRTMIAPHLLILGRSIRYCQFQNPVSFGRVRRSSEGNGSETTKT